MSYNDVKKIILFSGLVSLNIVIWYEIFGLKFAISIIVLAILIVLFD